MKNAQLVSMVDDVQSSPLCRLVNKSKPDKLIFIHSPKIQYMVSLSYHRNVGRIPVFYHKSKTGLSSARHLVNRCQEQEGLKHFSPRDRPEDKFWTHIGFLNVFGTGEYFNTDPLAFKCFFHTSWHVPLSQLARIGRAAPHWHEECSVRMSDRRFGRYLSFVDSQVLNPVVVFVDPEVA